MQEIIDQAEAKLTNCINLAKIFHEAEGTDRDEKKQVLLDTCDDLMGYLLDQFPHPTNMIKEQHDKAREEVRIMLKTTDPDPITMDSFPVHATKTLLKYHLVPLVQCSKWYEFTYTFISLVL